MLAIVVVAMSGCGDSDSDGGGGPAEPQTTGATTTVAPTKHGRAHDHGRAHHVRGAHHHLAHEGIQVGGEPLGALPVWAVAGLGVHP
jgi:hypothetical protein